MEASRIGGKSVFDYFTLPRPLGMMHYANRYPKVNARHTRGRNTDNDSDTTRNQESVKKTYPVLYLTESKIEEKNRLFGTIVQESWSTIENN